MAGHNRDLALLCRVKARLCALPIACVAEIMRRLPIDPMPGAPPFVLGLAIIRGAPMPVVDVAQLFEDERSDSAYLVSTLLGNARVALAVDSVLGVRPIPDGSLQALPSLLENAASDVVSRIGALDDELLLVLSNVRVVPQDVWDTLEAASAAA